VAKGRPQGTSLQATVTLQKGSEVDVLPATGLGNLPDGVILNLDCSPFSASLAVIELLTSGDSPDNKPDKGQKIPRDELTRKAIAHVNRHRRKVALGKAEYMSLIDLIKELAGDLGESEVRRLDRALRPDRHGHLLGPDSSPDK
jgi:hypothetical protein